MFSIMLGGGGGGLKGGKPRLIALKQAKFGLAPVAGGLPPYSAKVGPKIASNK